MIPLGRMGDAYTIYKPGDYNCNCKVQFLGENYGMYDESPGGIDITPSSGNSGKYLVLDYEKERRNCRQNNCEAKTGNRQCDMECNKLMRVTVTSESTPVRGARPPLLGSLVLRYLRMVCVTRPATPRLVSLMGEIARQWVHRRHVSTGPGGWG